MEHKEYLEQKSKSLMRKFENNKEIAQKLMAQKKLIDAKLEQLVDSGSLISAKIAAIQDMLNE